MTSVADLPPLDRHTVLRGASWEDYEQILDRVGNGSTRVTYARGSIEIRSPLPEHERPKRAIGRLVENLTVEVGLPLQAFGSTTFRRKDKQAGLEPDECFYIQNEAKVRGMTRFEPKIHPAPDLAIEVDVLSQSIAREPVYADLGVPELWRYCDQRIAIRILGKDGTYADADRSAAFPFLPMDRFEQFLARMLSEEQNGVIREFREWARSLPR
ncbi:MAG: hypothetical protein JWP03_1885 [Phycisphaerales bacterium]|jgi:Uma2 family endonuclease|nr:hypothetical protein [Phycisphaerales bacterium]